MLRQLCVGSSGSSNNWLWHRRCSSRWALGASSELAAADARGDDGRWKRYFYQLENHFTEVPLRVGDMVQCRWGDEVGQRYSIPRLNG